MFSFWYNRINHERKGGEHMAMTPAKRHQARVRQEAIQKARKDERLGLAKKTAKKKGRK